MRIGLIQTRGIGDIIIALPIADYFLERGDEVYWPIDSTMVPMFQPVKPEVNFIPVPPDEGYFYETPLAQLRELQCDRIITLYSYLGSNLIVKKINDVKLSSFLKFDEYKYAIAGVPFSRKWDLRIMRNLQREEQLKARLNISRPYICFHGAGSTCAVNFRLPSDWTRKYQVVEISALTDSPFDWISTLEQASKLLMIDSCFSNLVEQLNLKVEKYFIPRSAVQFTPVLKNGWIFVRN
jgi:hypothetical protein